MSSRVYVFSLPRKVAARLVSRLPSPVSTQAKRIYYRGEQRYCPVCNSDVRCFLPFGNYARKDACCPVCGSLERHRAAWEFLNRRTDLSDGTPKSVLHFAPEPPVERRLRQVTYLDYTTADLMDPHVDRQIDITAIPYADNSLNVIICSHVLEHVPDDRRAIAEIFRVLKPHGWALVAVPILAKQTLEDATITTPEQRARVYGQYDHVRLYGEDFPQRLTQAGFQVHAYTPADVVGSENIVKYGLSVYKTSDQTGIDHFVPEIDDAHVVYHAVKQ